MRLALLASLVFAVPLFASSSDASSAPRSHRRTALGANGRIAYVRADFGAADEDIYVVAPDGTRLRRLTTTADEERTPSFSPDGTQLVFARASDDGRSRLYVVRADGRSTRRLRAIAAGAMAPAWSPDGSQIAYVRLRKSAPGCAVFATQLANGRTRRLYAPPRLACERPAWASDARHLLVAADVIYRIDAAGRGYRKIGGNQPLEAFTSPGSPAWSPDGRTIAFVRYEACGGSCEVPRLFLMTADGRNARQVRIARSDAGSPAWSPDGSSIAFVRSAGARAGSLMVLDVATENARAVTYFESARAPTWQPRCQVSGLTRDDRLSDRAGTKLVCGFGGRDLLHSARGGDHVLAGPGNDRVLARNGHFDLIGCGPGIDTVVADASDAVAADCERVRRERS